MHPAGDPFLRLVEEALAEIPEPFRARLENVPVFVEDEPGPELRAALGAKLRGGRLFGLYQGTPLPLRTHDHAGLPDRIILFRRPLEEAFPDPEDLRREVAVTLLHEVAHHFGIGEARLEELGLG